MLRDALKEKLTTAVQSLIAEGFLPSGGLTEVEVADPKDPSHGDFACSFALAASKAAGKPPREIAERLAAALLESDGSDSSDGSGLIQSVEIAGPGFINIALKPEAISAYVSQVLSLGVMGLKSAHGQRQTANGSRLNVEFVSVNPNGPITVGSGRGAAFGSTLCNVLEAAGHKVHREYYINDGTNSEQMRLFALSVKADFFNLSFGIEIEPDNMRNEELAEFISKFFLHIGRYHGGEEVSWFSEKYDQLIETAKNSPGHELHQLALKRVPISKMLFKDFGEVLKVRYWLAYSDGLFDDSHIAEPSGGYRADYVKVVARSVARELLQLSGNRWEEWLTKGPDWFQSISQKLMVGGQVLDLSNFSTTFDTWFSEQSLHDSGKVQECIEELKAKGAADEEPYQLEIIKKKGEPDEVKKFEQPIEEEEDIHGEAAEEAGNADLSDTSDPTPNTQHRTQSGKTLWLRSTKFDDQKDRVLKRKDGRLTYIASDVAYHKDKFSRGSKPDAQGTVEPAEKLITILGPDHHGYIGRLTAVVAALLEEVNRQPSAVSRPDFETANGQPLTANGALLYRSPEERDACLSALEEAKKKLEVVIFQIVRFVKDGKPAPMRKRDGNIYSLRDLMLEIGRNAAPKADEEEQMRIGKDVARFFYLMRSHDTHMDFDLDLAEKQSDENPVYYVQYAHARICSVLAKARDSGFDTDHGSRSTDHALLTHPKELSLIKKILDLPNEIQRCAEDYGVHRLTSYAMELARTYHGFYDSCRVIQPEQPELTKARIALCQATKIGLQAVFELLGISAPERMERAEPEPETSNA